MVMLQTSVPTLVLLDDIIVALGAAVTTASLIVLLSLLSRYRVLVRDASRSTELAKNLWDAMNSRLNTQDTRIVDLMAKVEVYSVRSKALQPASRGSLPSAQGVTKPISRVSEPVTPSSQPISQSQQPQSTSDDTEPRILRALVEGPKTANQIRDVIGLSREHTGRLMKLLFTQGLVVRNDQNKPYVYEVTEAGHRYLSNM